MRRPPTRRVVERTRQGVTAHLSSKSLRREPPAIGRPREKKTLSPRSRKRHDRDFFPRGARPASMSAEAGEGGIFTRTRKRTRVSLEAAPAPETGKATTFAGLPRDIENQILGRADVQDLARLRAVSHSMRDAVDATLEDRRDTALAAKLGCLTALKNLLQRGHLDRGFVCTCAAEGGHLKVLRWAREKGCPWDESTCAKAAEGGHLEVLQWARANGCPWDDETCAYAAKRGNLELLELLKWARENGCPTRMRRMAATSML